MQYAYDVRVRVLQFVIGQDLKKSTSVAAIASGAGVHAHQVCAILEGYGIKPSEDSVITLSHTDRERVGAELSRSR